MKPSSLVGHVLELLRLIERGTEPADNVVNKFFRERRYLGAKDRRFISDTFFDILRHYRKIRFVAEEAARQLDLPTLSPLVVYMAYATRIRGEDPASVLSAVESTWRFTYPKTSCEDFLSAAATAVVPPSILRHPIRHLALEYSFPEFIIAEWVERFGEHETSLLCLALNQQAPTVVRVNTLKTTREQCQARLAVEGVESEPTTFSPVGLMLHKRINTQALQSFRDGWFEIQDEGSQLLSLLTEAQPGQVVVDACAGGGGKTLHLAALMDNRGTIYAVDVDATRLDNIRPRLARSGTTIVQLFHARQDAAPIPQCVGAADVVLVDAPCSGVGTVRRNPGAKLRVSEASIERMAQTQRRVLEAYAPLVRPGGRLVYSTCTLLRKENEERVEEFLHLHPEFTLLPAPAIIRQYITTADASSPYLSLYPHRTTTDGFFAAVMVRSAS